MLVFLNPLGMYVHRKLNIWKNQKVLFGNILKFLVAVLLIVLICSFMIYFYSIFVTKYVDFSIHDFIILVFCYSVFGFLCPFIAYVLNMLHCRLSFTILTVLTAFGIIAFGYLFVNLFGNTAQNWLLGTVI